MPSTLEAANISAEVATSFVMQVTVFSVSLSVPGDAEPYHILAQTNDGWKKIEKNQ